MPNPISKTTKTYLKIRKTNTKPQIFRIFLLNQKNYRTFTTIFGRCIVTYTKTQKIVAWRNEIPVEWYFPDMYRKDLFGA